MTQTPDWYADAECRGLPTEWWFPEPGQTADRAIAICNTCPVQQQCADAGRNEPYGIWGGRGIRKRRHVNAGGRTASRRQLLELLTDTPRQWSTKELADRMPITYAGTQTNLYNLERSGLVARERRNEGSATVAYWTATPLAGDALAGMREEVGA